jgi:predicted nucleotide-binding protein
VQADEVRNFLRQRRVAFNEGEIRYGIQFRCRTGEVINSYDSGKVVLGGKASALSQELADMSVDVTAASRAPARPAPERPRHGAADKQVFIVYGHDTAARDGLELVIRRMGLEPIVLANLPAGGDTIIEKLEKFLGGSGSIGFACVLLTPDDEGYAVGKPEDKRYRARQNVVLELGMVLARLGRQRVATIYKGSVELPSDIAGLIYIPFQERIEEVTAQLFKELESAGYNPDPSAL